jgi:H/ACA ribonucleoprotein complex subunit 4
MEAEELLHNGIIILDKWCGPTSHDVTATVRKILELKKTGQSGTLDPMVSGLLIITLENACKVIPALQHLDKEYVGIMHLHKEVSDDQLNKTIKDFIGKIKQLPPVRSAVARKERIRNIYSFEIIERNDKDVLFRVKCESGTYIRKLVDDIGKKIGGAHMAELRRTKVGTFSEEQAVHIQDLVDSYEAWKQSGDEKIKQMILPVEAAVQNLPKVVIKDTAVASVIKGSPVYPGGVESIDKADAGELMAIMNAGQLIALGKYVGGKIAVKTDRIIVRRELHINHKKISRTTRNKFI